ncbi:MAG: hypothetical protein KDN22_18570 [Verrucomicrobiae bacterium]|nr:hypothetical protein [Verrucomicrobiae bacterium]
MKSEVTFWVLAGAFFCLGQKVWAQDAAGADQLLRDVSAISNEAGAIFSGDSDETALKWANLVGETDNGFSFRLEEMFFDWARSRPDKAIEAMEISALSGEQQLRVLESIQKRDRASNSGVESQRTIREILGESRSDPVTAMKAVETMEEGRGKDMMRRIVQYHLDQADLNRALTQAAGMQDGDAKDERFRSLAMALARSGEFSRS